MAARALASRCPGLALSHRAYRGAAVLLPIGSFEDHGSLPPSLDTLLALEVACEASRLCGAAVAWPLGYGFSPEHSWSVSLGEDEVASLARRLVEGLLRRGAARVLVVDGHYGHREAVARAVRDYVNVWDLLWELGVRGFEAQLGFERLFWEGRARGIIGSAARRLCSLL